MVTVFKFAVWVFCAAKHLVERFKRGQSTSNTAVGVWQCRVVNHKDYALTQALPLRNFLNYVNVSYQIGKRGALADNMLEEQYQRVVIGLTLGDIWFRKVKID